MAGVKSKKIRRNQISSCGISDTLKPSVQEPKIAPSSGLIKAILGGLIRAIHDIWFQSSPATNGGCYETHPASPLGRRGFNPHPPRMAGAMKTARCFFRRSGGFNPHPPRMAGAISLEGKSDEYRRGGSILTRHEWRVLLEIGDIGQANQWFQSSPATNGGCYSCILRRASLGTKFQSSPAIRGGCYGIYHLRGAQHTLVSILTRHSWRVLCGIPRH